MWRRYYTLTTRGGPSRGLLQLHDCDIFTNLRLTFVWSSSGQLTCASSHHPAAAPGSSKAEHLMFATYTCWCVICFQESLRYNLSWDLWIGCFLWANWCRIFAAFVIISSIRCFTNGIKTPITCVQCVQKDAGLTKVRRTEKAFPKFWMGLYIRWRQLV